MSNEQEKNQILTQQPQTISTVNDEVDSDAIASADSTPATAETPAEIPAIEDTLIATPAPAETPAEIAAPEDISTALDEAETVPIPAANAPETSQIVGYSHPTTYTANPEPKPARIWQILAVFLSGMLVGSVLSLGALLGWKMYQERANIQIKVHSDVPLPESPPPVPAVPANRLPGVGPAPVPTLPATSAPSPAPTQIPGLSGVPQLAPPSPSPSPAASSAAVETPVTERVSFQAGATGTTLSNSLRANKSKRYLLDCNSGQSMTVKVQEGQVSAEITAPNGEKVGTANSTSPWQGQLASSGDYTIEISGDREANYGVKIEVK